nr:sulfatase-like hydrolase/transferase [Chitinophagaceae bacterium]
ENKNYFKQRLGFCDGDMATVFAEGINKSKSPFLNCWFTISSHSPYDIPTAKIKLTEIENDYVNTVSYFDNAMKSFFEKIKNENWYSNTLFVIVSDHSHASHKNLSNTDPDYHHIPLLFFGEVLNKKFQGVKIENVVSQLDISYTILESLGVKNFENKFPYSKSLLNTKQHFAPYTYHNGAGFIIDSSVCCYDMNNLNKPVFEKNNFTFLNYFTQAFHQTVYEDYRLK